MNILRTTALIAAFSLITPAARAIEFGYSAGSDNHLYQIDLATGAAIDLGPLGLAQVEGMTFQGVNTLLGIGGAVDPQNTTPQALWNLTTPPGAAIGNTAVTTDDDSGLASHNGQLFAVQGSIFGSQILELNPATGSTVQSAFITAGFNDVFVDSLAIDSQGNAFAADASISGPTGALYTIDLTGSLGAASLVGNLGIANLQAQSGLDFDSNDVLYLLLSDGRLYTVNTLTGSATLIAPVLSNGNPLTFHGGFAIGNLSATAVTVPEPATATLALLASCAAMIRRRR